MYNVAHGIANAATPTRVEGSEGALSVDLSGRLRTVDGGVVSGTAAVTAAASSTSSASVLASNAGRVQVIMVNTDANNCYLKFGATASASSFTYLIPGNGGTLEYSSAPYKGAMHAVWAGDGSGALIITEVSV